MFEALGMCFAVLLIFACGFIVGCQCMLMSLANDGIKIRLDRTAWKWRIKEARNV